MNMTIKKGTFAVLLLTAFLLIASPTDVHARGGGHGGGGRGGSHGGGHGGGHIGGSHGGVGHRGGGRVVIVHRVGGGGSWGWFPRRRPGGHSRRHWVGLVALGGGGCGTALLLSLSLLCTFSSGGCPGTAPDRDPPTAAANILLVLLPESARLLSVRAKLPGRMAQGSARCQSESAGFLRRHRLGATILPISNACTQRGILSPELCAVQGAAIVCRRSSPFCLCGF